MNLSGCFSRRTFLMGSLAGLSFAKVKKPVIGSASPPSSPVGIARCSRYEYDLIRKELSNLFDQIGGISSLVKGKTLTVKVNLTGNWQDPVYTLSEQETVFTHPMVTLAALSLFQELGARRIVLCESSSRTENPKENFQWCGYDVQLFESMISSLQWEDTRNKGTSGDYLSLPVEDGGVFYDHFHLNHRYVETDAVISIAKMKNHDIAGVTLAMKNLFGITPNSIYSEDNVLNDPENATAARIKVLHTGEMRPTRSGEILPVQSNHPGIRVPNIIVDIVKARPIDLSIIDGIVSTHGGEGPWQGAKLGIVVPRILIVGKNPVCTDSVGAAVMGYDPEAADGQKPFFPGINHIRLAADRGIGTNRLNEIDVTGLSIREAKYSFLPNYKPDPEAY